MLLYYYIVMRRKRWKRGGHPLAPRQGVPRRPHFSIPSYDMGAYRNKISPAVRAWIKVNIKSTLNLKSDIIVVLLS
jgi:hypothetical protein